MSWLPSANKRGREKSQVERAPKFLDSNLKIRLTQAQIWVMWFLQKKIGVLKVILQNFYESMRAGIWTSEGSSMNEAELSQNILITSSSLTARWLWVRFDIIVKWKPTQTIIPASRITKLMYSYENGPGGGRNHQHASLSLNVFLISCKKSLKLF